MADKCYYDTQATGTTSTEITFFSHTFADGENVTNLTESYKLDRDFELRRIELIPAADISVSDAQKLMEKSVIKLYIDDQPVLELPTPAVLTSCGIDVHTEPGNTGTSQYVKVSSTLDGYQLEEPIRIPAGTRFYVKLFIDSAFGTDTNLMIALYGRV